jgi:hypothetical protein
MKKNSKNPKKRNYIGYIIFISMWLFLGYLGYVKIIEYIKIKSHLEIRKGVILETNKTGAKGAVYCKYKFYYDNKIYTGFDYNDTAKVGDSIMISFDKESPNTNKLY